MTHIDFFIFFRWTLALIATVYATVVSLQSLWSFYVMIKGKEKYRAMLRRYLVLHTLRLRFQTFGGDVLICVLLCVVFVIIWHAHHVIADVGAQVANAREYVQHP